jgi:hypothetical protein
MNKRISILIEINLHKILMKINLNRLKQGVDFKEKKIFNLN